MPGIKPPNVECNSVSPGFVVRDITEAVGFYTKKLGFTVGFLYGDPPRFAGMNLGKVSLHLMTDQLRLVSGSAYFAIEDADELYEFHVHNGVEIIEPIGNRDYEMRDYLVRDIDGNYLAFGHYKMSTTPPLKIERVDVPVRLEKRLAALLKDLAGYKGMSIDSTLEETLLHTFEPYGDSVASPHTKTTLGYIEELKKKHGIDYDCHASYRFVE